MFTRTRTARQAQADAVFAERARLSEQHRNGLDRARSECADQITAAIEAIRTDYYAASALCQMDRNVFQSGILSGCVKALSHLTGIDEITLGYRMEHSLPIHGEGNTWGCVVDTVNGCDVPVVLHDGLREPVQARLNRLHHRALVTIRHPLASYYAENYLTTTEETPVA